MIDKETVMQWLSEHSTDASLLLRCLLTLLSVMPRRMAAPAQPKRCSHTVPPPYLRATSRSRIKKEKGMKCSSKRKKASNPNQLSLFK